MLKKPDDASSPSEENPVPDKGFISLDKLTPLVKEPAKQLMHYVPQREGMPHKKDIEVIESGIGQTHTEICASESTVQDAVTATNNDKSKSKESVDVFGSVLNTALQEYGSQQQRLLQYIEQSDKLRNDVDRLANRLEKTEQQRQQLIFQNSQATTELNDKIEELTDAIQVTNEQRQQLDAAVNKEESLCNTIRDYEFRCLSLEVRALEADDLDRKITDLNAELQQQRNKIDEIQIKALAQGKDNEMLKLALDEAGQYRRELEVRNKQTKAEFDHKADALTKAMHATEEKHHQLEARHIQSAADYSRKIEELTETLQTAEKERQQLEVENTLSTADFTTRVEELTAALYEAGEKYQQLELRHSQSIAEFTARVDMLTSAQHVAEQEREQFKAKTHRVTTELNQKVDKLSGALQTSEDQCRQLETETH